MAHFTSLDLDHFMSNTCWQKGTLTQHSCISRLLLAPLIFIEGADATSRRAISYYDREWERREEGKKFHLSLISPHYSLTMDARYVGRDEAIDASHWPPFTGQSARSTPFDMKLI